ncbi:MAG: PAS domain-containing protein [Gudongella sp.]|nr:PAS domain-containing protein [Gudongella sp.]
MSSGKNKSDKIHYHGAEDLLPDRLLRLSIPGTLTRLQEIDHELSDLQLQKDELQQARTDLELLLEQYTTLYDSAPAGYLTLNRSGMILQVNSAGARLFGVERSQLINQYFQKFMSVDSYTKYTSFLEDVYNNHSQEIFEFELQRPEDTIIVHMEARENKNGDACIATLIDVTAEEQAKLLHKEENKYRIIYENITQGIVLCNHDGKVVSANQAAETILNLTLNEMETRPLVDFFSNPIHEDGKAFTGRSLPFMKILNSNEATQGLTMGYKSKNSTYYTWIVVSAMAMIMPDEDDVQFLISFDDITSQKNLVLYNTLTIREKQVFQMLVKGYGRKQIAENLDITPKTVDKHKENLMEKLKMYSPDELVDFSKQL